jgi:hypothetical protein
MRFSFFQLTVFALKVCCLFFQTQTHGRENYFSSFWALAYCSIDQPRTMSRRFSNDLRGWEREGPAGIWLDLTLVLGVRVFWDVDWAAVGEGFFVFGA